MQNYRVLIVDDDELTAFHHKAMVEHLGHTVVGISHNGEDALAEVHALHPDIVLLDIVLPGKLDGIDVGEKILASLDIPVIYITGHSPDEFIERARITEPYGYLTKPVSERELAATISIGVYKATTERYLKETLLLCESMESICDPVVSLDSERRIMFLNRPAKEILIDQGEVVGKIFQKSLLPIDHKQWLTIENRINESMKRELPIIDSNTITLIDANGITKVFNALTVPLRNKSGDIHGTVLMLRNVTEIKALEFDLRQERNFINGVLDTIDALVIVLDRQGAIIRTNQACTRKMGYGSSDLEGHMIWDKLLMKNDRAAFKSAIEGFSCDRKPSQYETYVRNKSSGLLVVAWSIAGLGGVEDGSEYVLVTGVDITARKSNEQALVTSEQRFRDVVEAAGEFVWETDAAWRYTYLSERMEAILGYKVKEMLSHTPAYFFHDQGKDEMQPFGSFNDSVKADGFRGFEHAYKTKSGDLVWLRISGAPVINSQSEVIGYRGVGEDVTERKRIEQQIELLATRDALTLLPNRLLLNDRVSQGIYQAKRTGEMLALFFIDLDQFKHINDSLGHDVGDALLVKTAARLEECVRRQDTVARLGGDEFIVVLCGLNNIDEIIHIAQKILHSVSQPLTLYDHELIITCSIGISLFPSDGMDIQALMSNSDTAMYHAKSVGRNNFQFYCSEMNVKAIARQRFETSLRVSSESNDFSLVYQAKVDISSGCIIGVEALLRWDQSGQESVSPDIFIPVAEKIGLINHIGEWVLQAACEQNRRWRDCGYQPIKVGVNLSVLQISSDIVNTVSDVLQKTGLEPAALDLEITESLMIDNIQENIDTLNWLRKIGVSISMDDFGTGYSSLSYLKNFPLDTLKIDKSFVREITTDKSDIAIVNSVITMAKSLGLIVLAEGVESKHQLDILRNMGCDEYQGYYFGRPVHASEFERAFLEVAV